MFAAMSQPKLLGAVCQYHWRRSCTGDCGEIEPIVEVVLDVVAFSMGWDIYMLGKCALFWLHQISVYMNTVSYSSAKVNRKKMVQSPQATWLLDEIVSLQWRFYDIRVCFRRELVSWFGRGYTCTVTSTDPKAVVWRALEVNKGIAGSIGGSTGYTLSFAQYWCRLYWDTAMCIYVQLIIQKQPRVNAGEGLQLSKYLEQHTRVI